MSYLKVSLPEKWKDFLNSLASEHEIDLDAVVVQLCEWAFNDAEGKEEFKDWLDEVYPRKGDFEEKNRIVEEDAIEDEEEDQEESEEESHDHRD